MRLLFRGIVFLFTLLCWETAMACDITPGQLQDEALVLLKKEYPKNSFARGSRIDVVLMGEVEFGLQHLRSKLCLSPKFLTPQEREDAMREHFRVMMSLMKERDPKPSLQWSEAKNRVFLQFLSTDYIRNTRKDQALVTRDFLPDVKLAVVLKQERGYSYVRRTDSDHWKIRDEALFEAAKRNLALNSQNIKLQGGGDPDRFLAVEEKDGYDAIRIFDPGVRQAAAEFLGNPFYAMIPNRDFLVMWSAKNSTKFQLFARQRVEDDFRKQPYALSTTFVRVWSDGRIEPVR